MDRRLWLLSTSSLLLGGCYRDAAVSEPGATPEQTTIDRSAVAVERMRQSGQFPALDYFLSRAEGVMIFPRVVKAAFVLGGEGGSGVLLARDAKGEWSAPAFYGLGAGSAGFQLGYQEATVVLVFMNRPALMSAIDRGLTLGADASVAAGTVGDSGHAAAANTGKDVYQFVDVGGLFAGVSLDGTVVGAREKLNQRHYGADASTYRIVVERRFDRPGAERLRSALGPRAAVK